jgi:hypothetical protein
LIREEMNDRAEVAPPKPPKQTNAQCRCNQKMQMNVKRKSNGNNQN